MKMHTDDQKYGNEEGDICNRDSCTGVIQIKESENCSCHINPPCSSCVNAPLICPECEWEMEENAH